MIRFLASAAHSRSSDAVGAVLPWLGVLFVIVLLGVVALYIGRRIVNNAGSSESDAFSLHELRQLRKRGMLTDEEFEKAKDSIIGRLAGSGGDDRSGQDDAADRVGPDDTSTSR